MANVLFTNVRVLDGSGEYPFTGEVLVQGNRIRRVAKGSRNLPMSGVTVIDGAGATLMPGPVWMRSSACRPKSTRFLRQAPQRCISIRDSRLVSARLPPNRVSTW